MTRRPLSRIARRLIRMYPQAWRERYEEEMVALLDESPAGFADVAELARGLLLEHVRALVLSIDRASRSVTILAALRPTFVVAVTASAIVGGYLLRRWPAPPAFSDVAFWLWAVLVLAFVVTKSILDRRRRRSTPHARSVFPVRGGLIALPVAFLVIVFYEWAYVESPSDLDRYWSHRLVRVFSDLLIVRYLSSGLWPGEELLAAFNHLEATEVQLRAAQKWVKGCHEMIALGVPSPLADAEAEVERWTRERDKALAQAEQFGYRARFRRA